MKVANSFSCFFLKKDEPPKLGTTRYVQGSSRWRCGGRTGIDSASDSDRNEWMSERRNEWMNGWGRRKKKERRRRRREKGVGKVSRCRRKATGGKRLLTSVAKKVKRKRSGGRRRRRNLSCVFYVFRVKKKRNRFKLATGYRWLDPQPTGCKRALDVYWVITGFSSRFTIH